MKKYLKIINDLVFHPVCPSCRIILDYDDEKGICKDCFRELYVFEGVVCDLCGGLLIDETSVFEDGVTKKICKTCLLEVRPFNKARAIFGYKGPIKKIINRIKSYGDTHSIGILTKLSKKYMPSGLDAPDYVIPVPVHPSSLKKRGFNQCNVLARSIFNKLPILLDCLDRIKKTPQQKLLGAIERHKNLKDAFFLKKPQQITGKKILLFDDVFTTGSTINACVDALKFGEPASIDVFTIARTLPKY